VACAATYAVLSHQTLDALPAGREAAANATPAASAAYHDFATHTCRALHRTLAVKTISDYYMTMNGVRIADLKSRLSEHLRTVRAGSSLTVLDRDTPIARIVPWKAANGLLQLRAPLPGAPKLQRVPLPPPLRLRGDVVKLLMEERQGDR
jgi:antitoxin (DNA-binding transcriptional repressor) of toxin-antitoxin stability system